MYTNLASCKNSGKWINNVHSRDSSILYSHCCITTWWRVYIYCMCMSFLYTCTLIIFTISSSARECWYLIQIHQCKLNSRLHRDLTTAVSVIWPRRKIKYIRTICNYSEWDPVQMTSFSWLSNLYWCQFIGPLFKVVSNVIWGLTFRTS